MEKFDLIFWIKSDNERNPTEQVSCLEEALWVIRSRRPGLVILSVSDGRTFDITIRDTRIAWFEDGKQTKTSAIFEALKLADRMANLGSGIPVEVAEAAQARRRRPDGTGRTPIVDNSPLLDMDSIGEKLKSVDASLVTESSCNQPYFVAINQDETGLSLNEVDSHADELLAYNSAIEMVKKHGGFSRVLKQVAMVTQISTPKIAVTFTKEN